MKTVHLDETNDEDCNFVGGSREALESLKKLKQARQDSSKVREVSERAFQLIEARDKLGLTRFLDQNASVSVIDLVDSRGYTLMHVACFKSLDEIAVKLMDRAIESVNQ